MYSQCRIAATTRYWRHEMFNPDPHDYLNEDAQSPIEDNRLVRSTMAHSSEVMEYLVEQLIADMGTLPTRYFDTQIIVTVVVTPLPDEVSTDPSISNN